MASVFTYGTLTFPAVISALCGKKYVSELATLRGYARYIVRRQVYPGALEEHGQSIDGRLYYGLSPGAVQALDAFEGELYQRQLAKVDIDDGPTISAYVYIVPPNLAFRLSDEPWDPDGFARTHLDSYVRLGEELRRRRGP